MRVAGTVRHGGVVAIARSRPILDFVPDAAREWAKDGKPLLILDGVGNPHNLGAIARSAAFFGLERMLLADRPDQALPSDASYRVAEGGFEHLNLHRVPLPAALRCGRSTACGPARLSASALRPPRSRDRSRWSSAMRKPVSTLPPSPLATK